MNSQNSSIVSLAKCFPNLAPPDLINKLNREWRQLMNHTFLPDTPTECLEFWRMISNMKLGDGTKRYPSLSSFIFDLYPFERQVVGNYSFGSSAITDGVHHLCVNVAGARGLSPAAGSHIVVTGDLRRNNYETIVLQIADMANIQILDDQIMDPVQIRNGFPRILRNALADDQPALYQQIIQDIAPVHHGIPAPVMQHNVAQQLVQAVAPLNNVPVHQQGVAPQALSMQHNVSPRLVQADEQVPIESIDQQDVASGFILILCFFSIFLNNIGRALPRQNCDDFKRRYNALFDREFPPFPSRSPGDRAGPSRPLILRRTNRLRRQVKK
ncbi:hypothetical protein HCN44_008833 [Aphidius gifuensis]|uniref:Uncharacterized protein n=1 Tax=Aphidius gifuensis TaxID=684658 RepID=A0A834Y405_APHGI|nr:hypothetical protein HCN44_008833 [Aphidius gifuensis]